MQKTQRYVYTVILKESSLGMNIINMIATKNAFAAHPVISYFDNLLDRCIAWRNL